MESKLSSCLGVMTIDRRGESASNVRQWGGEVRLRTISTNPSMSILASPPSDLRPASMTSILRLKHPDHL